MSDGVSFYAMDEHDRPELPWPVPADAWYWSKGNQWMAVVADWHEDWWEGADPQDIEDAPAVWKRPIDLVPSIGTLVYRDETGSVVTFEALPQRRPTVLVELNGADPVNIVLGHPDVMVTVLDWDEIREGEEVVSNEELIQYHDQWEEISPRTARSIRDTLRERGRVLPEQYNTDFDDDNKEHHHHD